MAIAQQANHLRIKVVDTARDGHPVVNIRLPISVVRWGMKMAQTFSPELKNAPDLDWDSIAAMAQEGEVGKLVEVEDDANHKTVEIWVE